MGDDAADDLGALIAFVDDHAGCGDGGTSTSRLASLKRWPIRSAHGARVVRRGISTTISEGITKHSSPRVPFASGLDADEVEEVDADRFERALRAGGADAIDVIGHLGKSKRSN